MGGSNSDSGFGIGLDISGNVYSTGYFQGTADFDPSVGPFNIISAGGTDIFVSKLDASGNFVWAKAFGGTGAERANSIAIDSSGNIFTTGWFMNSVDFDPNAGTYNLNSVGGEDIFISKLDINGNFILAKSMGGASDDRGHSVVVDAAGNIYSTGWFNLTADFDPGAATFNLTTSSGVFDIYVSKLNASGSFVWAKALGGSGGEGNSLALDTSRNVYTTGSFSATGDFDPSVGTFNLTSAGNIDIFISKLINTVENSNTPSNVLSRTADLTAPTVLVNQAGTQSDPTASQPINFTVVFSETINVGTFTGADVSLTGTAAGLAGATKTVSLVIGNTYNVAVNGLTGDGTVSASIAGGIVLDMVGNTNTASTSTDNTVTLNTTAPSVLGLVPSTSGPTTLATVSYTVTFSEAVVSVVAGDFTLALTGTTTGTIGTISGTGSTRTIQITGIGGNGTIQLNLNDLDGSIQNGLSVALSDKTVNGFPVTIDNTSPSLVLSSTQLCPSNNATFTQYTALFSESVTNFTALDVSVSNGSVSNFAGSGASYTFDVLPVAEGVVSVSIALTTCTDIAGNPNTASNNLNCTYDVTPPTALCKDINVQLDGNGDAIIGGVDIDNGSSDANGIATISVNPDTFNCSNLGVNTVTLSVTDLAGNTATCLSTVTVDDPLSACGFACPYRDMFEIEWGFMAIDLGLSVNGVNVAGKRIPERLALAMVGQILCKPLHPHFQETLTAYLDNVTALQSEAPAIVTQTQGYVHALAALLLVNQQRQDYFVSLYGLANTYAIVNGSGAKSLNKSLSEPYDDYSDLDGDGKSNEQEYNFVFGLGGTDEDFILVVTDPTISGFPSSGMPLPLNAWYFALIMPLLGLVALRVRKKDTKGH